MGVTKRVPRDPWLPDPIARRRGLPVDFVSDRGKKDRSRGESLLSVED